jgi:hypothetical protein
MIVDIYKIPIGVSLAVIALLIGGAIAASLLWPPRREETAEPAPVHLAAD